MPTSISLRAGELAQLVQGRLIGDPDLLITDARPLDQAGPHEVSFVADGRHQRELAHTHAGAIIAAPGFRPPLPPLNKGGSEGGCAIIETADPFLAFLKTFEHFHPALPDLEPFVDPRAAIDPTARIGPGCYIGPFVFIGAGAQIGEQCTIHPGASIGRMCRIGDHCTLYPHAVVYDGCTLGRRTILHAHAVIGADGFGYRFEQGRHVKIPQRAGVHIGDDVEIGAGTTIDRGTFEPTMIGDGTKIDNLVQIGHNCRIGKHNMLVSQVGIGGSSTTGDYVVMAGQVGVADHVHIGDGAMLGAQCGVPSDVPARAKVLGAPARPEREAKMILLSMDKLPEMRHDVRKIKQHLGMTG